MNLRRLAAFVLTVALPGALAWGQPRSALMAPLQPSDPAPPPFQTLGPSPVVVVDHKGVVVGQYFPGSATSNDFDGVLLNINGSWFVLPVTVNGFAQSSIQLLYVTDNCSGTAYANAVSPSEPLANRPIIAVLDNTIYYQGSPQSVELFSQQTLLSNGTSTGCISTTGSGSFSMVLTAPLPSFVPPFSLR